MKPNLFILITFILLLVACSSQPAAPIATPSLALELTATPEPEVTPVQPTLPIPTSTITPSPLPSPAPITQVCVSTDQKLGEKVPHQGILVLYKLDSSLDRTVFLHDLDKNQQQLLQPLGWIGAVIGVSPDRRQLLYEYDSSENDYRLALTDEHGQAIDDFGIRIPPELWWSYYNWHTQDTLRVVILDKNQALPRLYKIDTQEYITLKTDWENAYAGKGPEWELDARAIDIHYYKGANIVYDPSITRVIYPKRGEIISLTDVETGQELASIQLPQWGRLPRWSDDGKHLVLIASTDLKAAPGHDELYIVSRDGPEFKRLTYLTNQFEKVHISEYAWSPDGTRIAFWLNTTADDSMLEGTQSELAILDIESGEITRLCIEGISAPMRHEIQMTHTQPVWSPDGQQIAFAQLDFSSVNTYNVMVVDLKTQTAFKVATNQEPIGWMLKEP